jgi:predicted NBD/HSP70 family sugar kinase
MKVLVLDIGGNNVKVYTAAQPEPIKVPSGPELTPKKMVKDVLAVIGGQEFEVVSIGYPGPVVQGKCLRDPANLGKGWVGFNFEKAFSCPVKLVNDAAMQALGSYKGGRMLFLGLGTGLGSALIVDGFIEPLELAHLPYKKGRTYEQYVGAAALERRGKKKWIKSVFDVVAQLKNALQVEYVVLGGGNTKLLDTLPPETIRGSNENAREGGCRLWASEAQQRNTRRGRARSASK